MTITFDQEMRRIVADLYWKTEGSVLVNTREGFLLVSGAHSPIYLDGRNIPSNPLAMDLITSFARAVAEELPIDVIAGGESAGIPYSSVLSQKMGKPAIYVRKEPKKYGTQSQIEGNLKPGQRVLLTEDLITDGQSKESFIKGIRDAEGIVEYCLSVFDRLQGGRERLKQIGVDLMSLTDMDTLLAVGSERGYISREDYRIIRNYLEGQQIFN